MNFVKDKLLRFLKALQKRRESNYVKFDENKNFKSVNGGDKIDKKIKSSINLHTLSNKHCQDSLRN